MTADEAVNQESGTADDEVLEAIFDISQDMAMNITGLSDKSMQMAIMQHVSAIQAIVQEIQNDIGEVSQDMPTQSYDQIPP
tara:strand:+ start:3269 stop:3511 length:243 start_codon:yes stop_codon:yes gene_type:complete